MWGHYLVTLYRSLTRHRLYAALNVLGLAVGVAVFLVLWLDVRFETGFDRWLPNAQTVYRINSIRTSPGEGVHASADAPSMVGPLLKADYPQITAYTRVIEDDDPVTVGAKSDGEKVYFVDPDFFKVLNLPLLKGNASIALSSSGNIVINERIARKYFGSVNVVGAAMTVNHNGTLLAYRVAAVMKDLPADTHLKLDLLVPLTPAFEASLPGFSAWGSIYGPTYVRFRNVADAEAVGPDLKNFVERRAKGSSQDKLGAHPTDQFRLELTALPAIHFKDTTMEDTFGPGVDERVVASLGIVGLFTLVIAVLNYINLATARASLRAREVAVRKVLGATRATLMGQFLAEAIAVALLAVLIGLALTELVLPLVNAAGGSNLKLTYLGEGGVLPVGLLLVLLIGLGAGLYPAVVLSGFQPAPVLAASRMPGGGKLGAQIRNALVVVQFATAIGFTICTFVLSAQAKYLHDADRGFTRQGLVLVDSLSDLQLLKRENGILDAFAGVPGVRMVSVSDREPAATNISVTNISRSGLVGPDPNLVWERVGANYFKTYGVGVIAGRVFDPSRQVDDSAGIDPKAPPAARVSVILNESGVKAMGFASPAAAIGQTIRLGEKLPLQVIGVVRDVRFMSPHQPVGPIFYTYKSRDIRNAIAAVRYQGVSAPEMMDRLGAAWSRLAPEVPFMAKTADARLGDYYVPDAQRARLFTSGAVLAVAIGCVGLYGLAAFNTARRMKEIGIRKTLGASTADILRLLVGQFLRPVVLANLLAWPLAFLAMRNWLSSFDQRIALSPLYFVAATLLTLAIALATVVGQVMLVARAEPAKALRHE